MSEHEDAGGTEEDPTPGPDGPEPATAGKTERRPVRPLREALYQTLWVAYRDGQRSANELARLHRMSKHTVLWAIDNGWPEAGLPPLRERVRMHDAQVEQARQQEIARADRAAAEDKGKARALTWSVFQPRAARQAGELLGLLEGLAQAVRRSLPTATFTRYRKVRKRDPQSGKMVLVDEEFTDAQAMTRAVQSLAAAYKDSAQLVGYLTGNLKGQPAGAPDAPELTPEQIEQIRAGELPAGVTLDQVWAAFQALHQGGEAG